MKKFLEGSRVIGEIIQRCKPGVISAYPITPQTHIVEELAQLCADGELDSQFVNVESEHSAASVVLGASAAGVRSFSASSSQGLLLMAEVIFNIAGMRLPVVMVATARAISAPINIWNDQQDVVSLRDTGWIQLHGEDIQEIVDLLLIAYRLGEDKSIMLPVMVVLDGFVLTHGLEIVDIPEQVLVDKFLPAFNTSYKLDVDKPITMGPLVDPDSYTEARYAIHETFKDVLNLIPKLSEEFSRVFGRSRNVLVDGYRIEDAERVVVAMGSVCGTIREVVDELRAKGKKVGLLKVVCLRPFPAHEIYAALKNVQKVAVIDRALSLGSSAPLVSEIKASFFGKPKKPRSISSFIVGLGGRDITKNSIREIFTLSNGKEKQGEFIGLKPELLKDNYEDAV
jgi:pyruvate ferredoxin oxidoreductase alpha subunit